MEFVSANPSVVRYITQRVLLNAWLRAAHKHQPLPLLAEFDPGDVSGELPDMMGYDVEDGGQEPRFIIKQEGARLIATYGNDPNGSRTNRYLHDAIGAERYARVLPSYAACVRYRRPTYSVATIQDADGKDVSYERLLLPFGVGGRVEQIVASVKAISIEGGFRVDNLMGLQTNRVPVSLVNAVIDHTIANAPAGRSKADDVVEL